MAIGTRAMSDAINSNKICRRSIAAGIAALGAYGFTRNARAAPDSIEKHDYIFESCARPAPS